MSSTETFTNDSVLGTIDSTGVGTLGANALTIRYDATVNQYTLTANGRTQVFAAANLLPQPSFPADNSSINTSNSTVQTIYYPFDRASPNFLLKRSVPGLRVYTQTSGSTVDQLILSSNTTPIVASSDTGPADLVLSYTGFGSWFSGTVDVAGISGQFDYFTYGAFTADSAMPRSGTGTYAILMEGRIATNQVGFLSGNGQAIANFATGAISFRANNLETYPDGTSFSGIASGLPFTDAAFVANAVIAANANRFSGTFSYSGRSVVTGALNGRFYGPNAQEIGAVFSGQSASAAITGAIVGKK